MGRSATGGRNWEGFGPDPYLTGVATNASVSGIQSVGLQACSKHFIANEQETQRTPSTNSNGTTILAVSSNVDDRTIHELYGWPFAEAVRAGTAAVMCSYNRVNEKYACANPDTLGMLKDELDFPGYIVSDWYSTHGTSEYANDGLDIEMPGNVSALAGPSYYGDLLLAAVQNGSVSTDRLLDMAERVMRPYLLLRQDEDFPSLRPSAAAVFLTYQYGQGYAEVVPARNVRSNHAEVIGKMGAAGTVLLKNTNSALPFTNETQFGIFGNDAQVPTIGSVFLNYGTHHEGFEDGAVDIGGGSGTVRHTSLVSPLEAISKRVAALSGRLQTILDNDMVAEADFRTIYPIPQAYLLCLKAYASEGTDRTSIDLEWNATAAVESVAAICSNTIVIVQAPGVVAIPCRTTRM
jgi:beta-glucosidase